MSYYKYYHEYLLEQLLIEKILDNNNKGLKKNTLAYASAMARKQQKEDEADARESEKMMNHSYFYNNVDLDAAVKHVPDFYNFLMSKISAHGHRKYRENLLKRRQEKHAEIMKRLKRMRSARERSRRSGV